MEGDGDVDGGKKFDELRWKFIFGCTNGWAVRLPVARSHEIVGQESITFLDIFACKI